MTIIDFGEICIVIIVFGGLIVSATTGGVYWLNKLLNHIESCNRRNEK